MKQLDLPLGIEPRPWWGRRLGDERRGCGLCVIAESRDAAALRLAGIFGAAPGVLMSDAEFDVEWEA